MLSVLIHNQSRNHCHQEIPGQSPVGFAYSKVLGYRLLLHVLSWEFTKISLWLLCGTPLNRCFVNIFVIPMYLRAGLLTMKQERQTWSYVDLPKRIDDNNKELINLSFNFMNRKILFKWSSNFFFSWVFTKWNVLTFYL